MAVVKEFETPHGVIATYHKIVKAEIKPQSEEVEVWVAVYASAEARDTDKGALWTEYIRIPFAELSDDPRNALYGLITSWPSSYLHGGVSDEAQVVSETN